MGGPSDSRSAHPVAMAIYSECAPKFGVYDCPTPIPRNMWNGIQTKRGRAPCVCPNQTRDEEEVTTWRTRSVFLSVMATSTAEEARREKWRRIGITVGWTIGGVGFGLMALILPFVTPALRRYVLPYVPATPVQVDTVVGFLRGRRGKVVDLGSGDGRVVSV